jgi:CHAT domain-containing protein
MTSISLLRLALVASLFGVQARAAGPTPFDECLANLRKGPDTFIAYLCLGTPGLPERPSEVRSALAAVLRRVPNEPHARLYLALMRVYRLEDVPKSEFTVPLATFEQRHADVDTFLSRLALLERICFGNSPECWAQGPLLEKAEGLADAIEDPVLRRLAAIARIRWDLVARTYADARNAEERLNVIPGNPPEWLRVLEVTTRATLAEARADVPRAQELYRQLLTSSAPGSVAHAEALAGIARMTGFLAWRGLASREDAEALLRAALAEGEPLEIHGYDSQKAHDLRALLVFLLGRTEESRRLSERAPPTVRIEFLLHGTPDEREGALQAARELVDGWGARLNWALLLRAHAEFRTGHSDEGIVWGTRGLRIISEWLTREREESARLLQHSGAARAYQMLVADLLETGPSDPDHLRLAFEVSEQLRAQLLLESIVSRDNPSPRIGEEVPRVPQLQDELRPQEALVSFFVRTPSPTQWTPYVDGESWALILTRSGLSAVRLPPVAELEPAIKAWTRMLNDRTGPIEPGARRLYRDVLDPVVKALPSEVRSLILVPDGPLHQLPFDALSASGRAPYLADRFATTVVPSAAVWHHLRTRQARPPGIAVAFANTPEGPALQVAERRGEIAPGELGILLHARDEAQEAVDAFPRGSRLFAGADATPDRFATSEVRNASLIHFAAHGVVSAADPPRSFLLLAPGATGSGKLFLSDVQRSDWTGKTIVLSACETSTGKTTLAEGVLSLARGFVAGGASSVIGTLAQVRDDEQLALFRKFYAELRTGVSVGEAMSAAKREMIRRGAPPAAWANVVLLGDSTTHPRAAEPSRRSRWLVAVASCGLLLIAAAALLLKRRTPPRGAAA